MRRQRGEKSEGRRPSRFRQRKLNCRFCARPGKEVIDYKNVSLLEGLTDEQGRIRKARRARACRRHQSMIAQAIKRSREIALMPYVKEVGLKASQRR